MRTKRLTGLLIAWVVGAVVVAAPVSAKPKSDAPKPITVRGGFVNLPPAYCNPATITPGPETPPGSVSGSCAGAGPFDGGWTGVAYDTYRITVYANGDAGGTAEGWLYARYMGDGTYGAIHFKGTFSIDGETGTFVERADIVGGTCDFAGSSGTIWFTGHEAHGGYVARWSRPDRGSTAPCNPFDPAPELP